MSANHDERSHGELTVREAAARYESVDASLVNDWLREFLPSEPAAVLDVGAGSGRDAAWLASLGHDVVAVEPDRVMRQEMRRWHPETRLEVIADRLPELAKTFRSGLSFDFILVNAVWMCIAPTLRERAFRKLVTLLKPKGVIALTLREGPLDAGRGMHPVSVQEIEQLARRHGAYVEQVSEDADFLGRKDFTWKRIAVRLPDDGTGALPLIRRVVLNDNNTAMEQVRRGASATGGACSMVEERGRATGEAEGVGCGARQPTSSHCCECFAESPMAHRDLSGRPVRITWRFRSVSQRSIGSGFTCRS